MRRLTHGRGSNHGVGGKLAFFSSDEGKQPLGGCCGFNLRERGREEKLRALGETLSIGVEAKAASGHVNFIGDTDSTITTILWYYGK